MAFLERPISWGCWKKIFLEIIQRQKRKRKEQQRQSIAQSGWRGRQKVVRVRQRHTYRERERERDVWTSWAQHSAVFYTWPTSPKDQVVLWKRELLSINPSNIPRDTRQITTSRLCFSLQAHSHTCTYTLTAVNHHLLVFPPTSPSFRPSVSVWRRADNSDAEARGWHYTQHLVLHCLSMK